MRLIPTSSGSAPRTVEVAGGATERTASGLTNNTPYSVAVQAWNGAGAGPFGPAVEMQSAGIPPAVTGVNGATRGPGAGFDSESVTVSWNQQTDPNGPPLKGYTIYRNGAQIGNVGAQTRTFADTIPYDGNRYSYTVTATNGADLESPQGNPWTYTSIGVPSDPQRERGDAARPTSPSSSRAGRPAARRCLPVHPLAWWRQVGHACLRLRARERQ